jgi:hypothetical protein
MAAVLTRKKVDQPYSVLPTPQYQKPVPKVPLKVTQKIQPSPQQAPKISQKVSVINQQAPSVDEHKDPLPQKAISQVKANQPITFEQRKSELINRKVKRIKESLEKLLDDESGYCKRIFDETGQYPQGAVMFRSPFENADGAKLVINYRVEDFLYANTKKVPNDEYVQSHPKVGRCYKALLVALTLDLRTNTLKEKKFGTLFSLMCIEAYDKEADKIVSDAIMKNPSLSRIIQSLTMEEAENTNTQLLDYFFAK